MEAELHRKYRCCSDQKAAVQMQRHAAVHGLQCSAEQCWQTALLFNTQGSAPDRVIHAGNRYTISIPCAHQLCFTYLSTSDDCNQKYVDLYQRDDGSGRQQWQVRLHSPSPGAGHSKSSSSSTSCSSDDVCMSLMPVHLCAD